MNPFNLVTYCGLYCGLCAQHCRIPQRAQALRDDMSAEGYEIWGRTIAGFGPFWKFLSELADSEGRCSCRSGDCGAPFCEVRRCARDHQVEVCAFCDEYPCAQIQDLSRRYPTLLADGARMRLIGVEAWIAEQEARRRAGVVYADFRYPPTRAEGRPERPLPPS